MTALQTVKVVGKYGYLNTDPAMPFTLPHHAFGLETLVQTIMRATVDYDLKTSYKNCRYLALQIFKKWLRDQ